MDELQNLSDIFWSINEEERDRFVLEERNEGVLKQRFGDGAFKELKGVARKPMAVRSTKTLALRASPNVIFIPGIMGSMLKPKELAGVWWIDAARALNKIEKLALGPDGTDPLDPRFHVEPFEVDLSYEGFLDQALDQPGFRVVKHPYDWRKPLLSSTTALFKRVQEVYQQNGGKRIHLVAHSMGGLLIRATLLNHGAAVWDKIDRIVFIATPHSGTPIIPYYLREHLRGDWATWLLGKYISRQAFRTLWGSLNLLPAPRDIYPGREKVQNRHPCVNFDLYQAKEWELNLPDDEFQQFKKGLDETQQFHRRLFDSLSKLPSGLRANMAMIIGVGQKMPFNVRIEKRMLNRMETVAEFTREPGNVHRDGDGSVPVASAQLPGLGEYRFINGEHAALPNIPAANIPAVVRDTFAFLRRQPMRLPIAASGALQPHMGHSAADVRSSVPQLDGTARSTERWSVLEMSDADLAALDAKLLRGELPEFERVRIM